MVSARRNELLAELFQRSHRIEKWGRGIKMILEREPATEFEEIGTVQFVTTLKRNSYELTKPDAAGEATRKTPVKTPVKTPDMILTLLEDTPNMSLVDIAGVIGKSLSAVERACSKLVKSGRLRFVGPRKGGRWEVLQVNDRSSR